MFVEMARMALREPPDPVVQAMNRPPVKVKGNEQWIGSLELGQQADKSAFALLRQQRVEQGDRRARYYDCPLLARWDAGTPYTQIADELASMYRNVPHLAKQTLVIGVTGVGYGVADLFRQTRIPAKLVPVGIVTAHKAEPDESGGWRVPKRELVSTMHVLLGGRRFNEDAPLFKTKANKDLVKDLMTGLETFKAKIGGALPDNPFDAWREQDNDDLVLAVAMGAWWGEYANQRLVLA